MSVFVKICGLANAADVAAVAALRPDALGFVLWPKSKRAVRPEQVAEWTRDLPPGQLKVGVVVDESIEEVRRAVEVARLDVVQWHGFPEVRGQRSEVSRQAEADFFQALEKSLSGVSKLWKVHRLDRENPPPGAFVDALVLDSYSPAAPGGTGQTVDWTAARAFVAASRAKVILAGGLTPENIAEGIRAVRPWGVDVSSGVEAQPGRKDLTAVKRFIETCRAN
jgi:phosphoribosylanthranilate isomerase